MKTTTTKKQYLNDEEQVLNLLNSYSELLETANEEELDMLIKLEELKLQTNAEEMILDEFDNETEYNVANVLYNTIFDIEAELVYLDR